MRRNNDDHPAHGSNSSRGISGRLSRRQQLILEKVKQDGFVGIEDLASHYEVTSQTIRRDINQLCDEGLLRRYHGGAGVPSTVENLPYDRRQVMALEEKRTIATVVASAIPERASLFIDVGTTTEEIARKLLDHQRLRVVTNNLNVAQILASKPNFEIMVTGGTVRSVDRAVVGELAIDAINQFKVDIAILGTSGIDNDGTLLDFDVRKVRVTQAIIANARRVVLAADHSKVGRNAMVRVAHISEVDDFVTDQLPPQGIRTVLTDHNVRLHLANHSTVDQHQRG